MRLEGKNNAEMKKELIFEIDYNFATFLCCITNSNKSLN